MVGRKAPAEAGAVDDVEPFQLIEVAVDGRFIDVGPRAWTAAANSSALLWPGFSTSALSSSRRAGVALPPCARIDAPAPCAGRVTATSGGGTLLC